MKKWVKFTGWFFLSLLVFLGGLHHTSKILIHQLTEAAKGTPLFEAVEYVQVGHHKLAYRIYNPGQEKTVIMIHGFMGSSYEFNDFFLTLGEDSDFTFIAFDTMGFGLSDKPLDFEYTSQNHAVTLMQAIDNLNIDTFSLMGHSMGGGIAIRMSLLDQSRIENLVLIAAVGPELMERSESAPPLWFFDVLFKNYFAQRFGINSATVENLPQEIFAPFIIQNAAIPSAVLQKFTLDQDTVSFLDDLKGLTVRTFVIYGAQDSWTPPSLLLTYVQEMPRSSGYQLANSGHLPYLEQPGELISLIENFLNN
jgi:pimeloyl-ACP methyl ester carboxylesterase